VASHNLFDNGFKKFHLVW